MVAESTQAFEGEGAEDGGQRFGFLILVLRFFTALALFGFLCLFDVLDVFLEFVLEYFVAECSPFVEEKCFEVVEYLSVFGGVHDAIAFGEHDVEVFVEEVVNVGGIEGCLGRHNIP